MKSIAKTAIALLAGIAISAAAHAASYTFVDTHTPIKKLSQGQTYSNTWDISGEADFSTDLDFYAGTAEFWFADDLLDWPFEKEKASVKIEGASFWAGLVTGNIFSYQYVMGDLSLDMLASVAADGKLSYSIKSTKGDFYVKKTRLTVDARTANVPDSGSTLALLGLGLVGLAAVQRRRRQS